MSIKEFSPQFLADQLEQHPTPSSYCVALSGGSDSVVLLHALSELRPILSVDISAIHINHDLHVDSDDWQAHCEKLCSELDVPFLGVKVQLVNKAKGLEASAREARYKAFIQHLKPDEQLLMAHHLDDQAETVLMNLFQGAGPAGLAGMPARRSLGEGSLIRPLLGISRDSLTAYARAHELMWMEDPSNTDCRFDRNYLRHEVVPVIKARWGRAEEGIARAAKHQSKILKAEQRQAFEDTELCYTPTGEFDLTEWFELTTFRQNAALRRWLLERGKLVLSQRQLETLRRDLIGAAAQSSPKFRLGEYEIRRNNNYLYINWVVGDFKVPSIQWALSDELSIEKLGINVDPQVMLRAFPQLSVDDELTVRFRKGGETIRPQGATIHRSLKAIFQVNNVPVWKRDYIPLIYYKDCLILVYGYAKGECS